MIRHLAIPLAFAAALMIDVRWQPGTPGTAEITANEAEAQRRRAAPRRAGPASPRGAARRTTRRVIRRTNRRVNALPATGCAPVTINNTLLHRCGGTYYQPAGNTYVIVNVVDAQ